jgi:hypothetical protein
MSGNGPPRRGGCRHCAVQQVGVSSPRFTGRPINVCVTAAGHAEQRQRTDPTAARQPVETAVQRYQCPQRTGHRVQIIALAVTAAAISPRPRPTAKRRRGHPDAHDAAVRVNSTIVVGWLVTGFEVGAKQQHESRDHHRGRHSAFQKAPLSRAKALESPPSRRDQAGFFRQG